VESRRVADVCVVPPGESFGSDRRVTVGSADERPTELLPATSEVKLGMFKYEYVKQARAAILGTLHTNYKNKGDDVIRVSLLFSVSFSPVARLRLRRLRRQRRCRVTRRLSRNLLLPRRRLAFSRQRTTRQTFSSLAFVRLLLPPRLSSEALSMESTRRLRFEVC